VGDFDSAATRKVAEDLFGAWKSSAPYARLTTGFNKVAPASETIQTNDKANAFIEAGMRLNMSDTDPSYPAMVLGNYMLGGGFLKSRLFSRIRDKEGLSYGTGSVLTLKSNEPDGTFLAYAIAAPQNVAAVEKAMREEVAKVTSEGFTADEVKEAVDGWLQFQVVGRSQDDGLANILATRDYDGRTLSFDDQIEGKVRSLSPGDITAALKRAVDPANLTIIRAGDFNKAAAAAK
jgi:zinc protease